MRSPKVLLLLLANVALAAGLMLTAGCYTSPTSPNVLGHSSGGYPSGGGDDGGGGGRTTRPLS